eukprot:1814096-Rhodomonas_salina.2
MPHLRRPSPLSSLSLRSGIRETDSLAVHVSLPEPRRWLLSRCWPKLPQAQCTFRSFYTAAASGPVGVLCGPRRYPLSFEGSRLGTRNFKFENGARVLPACICTLLVAVGPGYYVTHCHRSLSYAPNGRPHGRYGRHAADGRHGRHGRHGCTCHNSRPRAEAIEDQVEPELPMASFTGIPGAAAAKVRSSSPLSDLNS